MTSSSPDSDVHDFYRNLVRAMDGLEPQIVTHKQLMRVMKIWRPLYLRRRRRPVEFEDNYR